MDAFNVSKETSQRLVRRLLPEDEGRITEDAVRGSCHGDPILVNLGTNQRVCSPDKLLE